MHIAQNVTYLRLGLNIKVNSLSVQTKSQIRVTYEFTNNLNCLPDTFDGGAFRSVWIRISTSSQT